MIEALAWVLPQEAAVLVLVAIGFAVMLGFRRVAVSLTGLLAWMVMAPALDPLFDVAFSMLPLWLVIAAAGAVCLYLIRSVLELLLGREAAGHVIGQLVMTVVAGIFRLAFLPLRLLFRAFT